MKYFLGILLSTLSDPIDRSILLKFCSIVKFFYRKNLWKYLKTAQFSLLPKSRENQLPRSRAAEKQIPITAEKQTAEKQIAQLQGNPTNSILLGLVHIKFKVWNHVCPISFTIQKFLVASLASKDLSSLFFREYYRLLTVKKISEIESKPSIRCRKMHRKIEPFSCDNAKSFN